MTIVNRQKGRTVETVVQIVIDGMKRFEKYVVWREHADETCVRALLDNTTAMGCRDIHLWMSGRKNFHIQCVYLYQIKALTNTSIMRLKSSHYAELMTIAHQYYLH